MSSNANKKTERWCDMDNSPPDPIDPRILKGMSFSFGKALTEEEFKAVQGKGKARVAKSLDLRDLEKKSGR